MQGCIKSCLQQRILAMCECGNPDYAVTRNETHCDLRQSTSSIESLTVFLHSGQCILRATLNSTQDALNCTHYCAQPCEYDQAPMFETFHHFNCSDTHYESVFTVTKPTVAVLRALCSEVVSAYKFEIDSILGQLNHGGVMR